MEVKQVDGKWLAKKSRKAKTWEEITDLIHIDGDFMSVMGKAGRTTFHSYLGKNGKKWQEMYGVTSLLNYWGEKDKLVQWAVDKAVDYIDSKARDFESEMYPLTFKAVQYLGIDVDTLKEARSAHKRSLEDAGSHGTDMHALVEDYINHRFQEPDPFPSQSRSQLHEFMEWHYSSGAYFIASEMPLHSKKLWTAGTTDFICKIGGKTYIGDLKTSNYVSYKQFIQCGAYALMYEEMGLGKIDGILIVHMPRTGGFKVHEDLDVENYKKDFEAIVRLVKRDKDKSYQLYS